MQSRPHVFPDIKDWPIHRMHQERRRFVEELENFTYDQLVEEYGDDLGDLVAKALYTERIRMKEEPWRIDPPDERAFWGRVGKKLAKEGLDDDAPQSDATNRKLLRAVIDRYAEEIVGTFRESTFLFARRFLTWFFNRLLNTAAERNFRQLFSSRNRMLDRLKVVGQVDLLRELVQRGTVVLVPTHSSNLDSLLISYALDQKVGVPMFIYGAGLNLYNTGYTAYFMNRLGPYRVDRRKKNPIYLATLKNNSQLALEYGTHSIFYPGGTRSRSGMLEDKLKMGLLGTAVSAQRANFERKRGKKIFIVPLILSYHVVLEAKQLIEQHLQRTGQEQYLKTGRESYGLRKLLKFAWKFFGKGSEITMSVGKPMDVLGNFVDGSGLSYDRHGRAVDVQDYFLTNGKVTANLQREREYTRILSDRIVDRYFKENVVLSSHLVAYCAFNLLRRSFPTLDLYGLLRQPADDFSFDWEKLKEVVAAVRQNLYEREARGQIKLSEQIRWDLDNLMRDGVHQVGVFHLKKPLTFNRQGELVSQDFKMLFFYHNRLEHYGLARSVDWQHIFHPALTRV